MPGVPPLSGGTLEEAGELRSAGTAEAAVATWVFLTSSLDNGCKLLLGSNALESAPSKAFDRTAGMSDWSANGLAE
jgi:hypothetical protein